MKTAQKHLRTVILILILLVAYSSSIAQKKANSYAPVVKQLDSIYKANKNFKNLIDNALSSAIPTPDGWSKAPYGDTGLLYIWPQKNFTDLLNFFQNWLTFVPNPQNGMQYYELLYGLCYKNPSAIQFVSTEPGLSWTKKYVVARGKYMDSPQSINDHLDAMKQWYKSMGTSWYRFKAPYDTTQGFKGYKTFNEFFTRKLREASKIVDTANNILLAPADGLVNIINSNLNTNSKIHTKYDEYLNVSQLLDGSKYANYFDGGTATATVLLPADYHHYHSPVSGQVVETKTVDAEGGVYFGMDGQFFTFSNNGNIGGFKSQYGIFGVYHRGYYIIKTEKYGYVAMIPIGLDDISSVNFEPQLDPRTASFPVNVKKGDRVGHFAYGGSTVILLFEPGVLDAIKLKQGSQMGVLNTK